MALWTGFAPVLKFLWEKIIVRTLGLFAFVFLLPIYCAPYFPYNFIVWNVGQGQWVTLIVDQTCFHIDMGGEFYPKPVEALCTKKKNYILITHWDWDHRSFIPRFTRTTRHSCLFFPRAWPKTLRHINHCRTLPEWIEVIHYGKPKKSRNAGSLVYWIKKAILIPGDSPTSEERHWSSAIHQKAHTLILGHHGSRTSTSVKLLKIAQPQVAIASAREQRYGHPHSKVIKKLKKYQVPLLRTEWQGHIYQRLSHLKPNWHRERTPYPNLLPQLRKSHDRRKH